MTKEEAKSKAAEIGGKTLELSKRAGAAAWRGAKAGCGFAAAKIRERGAARRAAAETRGAAKGECADVYGGFIFGGSAGGVILMVIGALIVLMGFFKLGFFGAIADAATLAHGMRGAERANAELIGWFYSFVSGLAIGLSFEAWGMTVRKACFIDARTKRILQVVENLAFAAEAEPGAEGEGARA